MRRKHRKMVQRNGTQRDRALNEDISPMGKNSHNPGPASNNTRSAPSSDSNDSRISRAVKAAGAIHIPSSSRKSTAWPSQSVYGSFGQMISSCPNAVSCTTTSTQRAAKASTNTPTMIDATKESMKRMAGPAAPMTAPFLVHHSLHSNRLAGPSLQVLVWRRLKHSRNEMFGR